MESGFVGQSAGEDCGKGRPESELDLMCRRKCRTFPIEDYFDLTDIPLCWVACGVRWCVMVPRMGSWQRP
jgi:hypothetical protein